MQADCFIKVHMRAIRFLSVIDHSKMQSLVVLITSVSNIAKFSYH